MTYRTLILIVSLMASAISVNAQSDHKNFLELKVTRGGGDGVPGFMNGMTLAYARDIGKGVMIKPSYLVSQGGGNLSNQSILINEEIFKQDYTQNSNIDNIQVTYAQYRSVGLGVQKSVNASSNGSLHIMLGSRLSWFHRQYINFQSSSELRQSYSSNRLIGYNIEVGYYHKIKDYLSLFATCGYVSNPYLFNFGIGASVGI